MSRAFARARGGGVAGARPPREKNKVTKEKHFGERRDASTIARG